MNRGIIYATLFAILFSQGCATTPGGFGLGAPFASSDRALIEETQVAPDGTKYTFKMDLKGMGDVLRTQSMHYKGNTQKTNPDGSVDIDQPWELAFGQQVEMTSPALNTFAETVASIPAIAQQFGPLPSASDEPARQGWLSMVLAFLGQRPDLLSTVLTLLPGN